MDWVTALNVAGPVAGLVIGGMFGRKKTKADAHSIVVTDAMAFGAKMSEKLDNALRRIDDLENRENRRDELARQHLRWDWRQVRQLADLGIEVEDPPALFLYDENGKTS